MRYFWLLGGLGSLLLGVVGAFLPVLPTTPFLLLAAACFSRGSPRLHRWLREHSRFGSLVRDWEEHRAIAPRAKRLAITMLIVVGGAGVYFTPLWQVQVGVSVTLVAVGIFILTRPSPPADAGVPSPEPSSSP